MLLPIYVGLDLVRESRLLVIFLTQTRLISMNTYCHGFWDHENLSSCLTIVIGPRNNTSYHLVGLIQIRLLPSCCQKIWSYRFVFIFAMCYCRRFQRKPPLLSATFDFSFGSFSAVNDALTLPHWIVLPLNSTFTKLINIYSFYSFIESINFAIFFSFWSLLFDYFNSNYNFNEHTSN